MRGYIFTSHEREMIRKFLQQNEKSYGFDQLRKRIRDNYDVLKGDMELIKELHT